MDKRLEDRFITFASMIVFLLIVALGFILTYDFVFVDDGKFGAGALKPVDGSCYVSLDCFEEADHLERDCGVKNPYRIESKIN